MLAHQSGLGAPAANVLDAERLAGRQRFLQVGADREAHSDFRLIAGANRDLARRVSEGAFREDLFARLNLWTFRLPGLAERREDIAPNLDYELDRHAEREGERVAFNREARTLYLHFATGPEARWAGNFRDLAASVARMATFSPRGRIDVATVEVEIRRLKTLWSDAQAAGDDLDAYCRRRRWRGSTRSTGCNWLMS
jgi:transcriptional regulatory protein RtcR